MLDYAAIPPGFSIQKITQGDFVVCPVCGEALVQTTENYIGCENLDHTGIIRHKGKVEHSWALKNLWANIRHLEFYTRYSGGVYISPKRYYYKMVPGKIELDRFTYILPKIENPQARLALCNFRGLLAPRFFIPTLLKGFTHAGHPSTWPRPRTH